MDTVFIKGLEAYAVIGVYDWEQAIRQRLLLDVTLKTCSKKAAASDNLNDALDYFCISERLLEVLENERFALLEALAERLSDVLQKEFNVKGLCLRLEKPSAVQRAQTVGLEIQRGDF